MMKKDVETYNQMEIHLDNDMMNLTNMWKAAGGDENQKPQKWLRQDGTRKFLKTLTKKLKWDLKSPLKITRGRSGGIYAHWQTVY